METKLTGRIWDGGKKNYGGKPNRSSRNFEIFDLFTGGKTPELAIFYNVACDSVENYVQSLSNVPFEKPLEKTELLSDKILTYLRQYLWKGNLDNKNDSGQPITDDEKNIIRQLLQKLGGIRNFQSHIWHDNSVIEFNNTLITFIEQRHDNAVMQLEQEPGNNSRLYLDGLKEHPLFFKAKDGRHYITQEGRAFILSFFLNKGNMASFLQQLIGSKRNDMPEYKFKHKVYMYYCHREGSSWDSMGLSNEHIEIVDEEKKQTIIKGRQAYKIINYLNDKPEYFNHAENIPLYYKGEDGTPVEVTGMPSLKAYIKANDYLHGIRIGLKEWRNTLPDNPTEDERMENERRKMIERKRREGTGYLMLNENDKYEFEITYNVLRHILTDVLLKREFEIEYSKDNETDTKIVTAEEHFYGVLRDSISSRVHIYDTLTSLPSDTSANFENLKIKKLFNSVYIDYSESVDIIDKVFYTKDQLRHLPISATPKLEELLIEWHQAFTEGKNNENKKRIRLLNYIRPIGSSFDESVYVNKDGIKKIPENTEPQPLVFHLSYYYKEQTQKKRKEDSFLEWGVQYLMDFNLLNNCYVEVEKYVYEKKTNEPESQYKLKEELQYVQKLPENYRLRIRDSHINIAIKNINLHGEIPEFLKLRIGNKVMKYLLYAVFDNKRDQQKTINDFIKTIAEDYLKIFTIDDGKLINDISFHLLEPFALPEYLYKLSNENGKIKKRTDPLRVELEIAVDKKIKWIDQQLILKQTYSRNQKNEVILKAYTFFDFSQVQDGKFLRKNEYEQMSICHYMLNQNSGKVPDLIKNTFKLKNRLNKEIYDIIENVVSHEWEEPLLDILFTKIMENRKEFLLNMKALVKDDDLPIKLIKPQLAFLNLTISDANLNEANRIIRQNKRKESLGFLPFAIHPALVLKYFYPFDFAAKKFDGNTKHTKGENKYENLFATLRKNSRLTTVLVNEYYNISLFEQLFAKAEMLTTEGEKKIHLKKQLQSLTGHVTDTHTKDIFLSMIAQYYLNSYDNIIADEFAKLKGQKKINIKNLFKKEIVIPLNKNTYTPGWNTYTDDEKNSVPNQLFITFRLHQADDYFFRSKKDKLGQLGLHYVNFRNEELEFYKDSPEFYDKINEWPDGTEAKPIPLGHLLQEFKNITNMADRLIMYILLYERAVINKYIKAEQDKDKSKSRQDCLVTDNQGLNFLPFARVVEMDKTADEATKNNIKNLRNSCLHNLIPLRGSYCQQTLPGTLVANTLSITERLAPDREKYKQYEELNNSPG